MPVSAAVEPARLAHELGQPLALLGGEDRRQLLQAVDPHLHALGQEPLDLGELRLDRGLVGLGQHQAPQLGLRLAQALHVLLDGGALLLAQLADGLRLLVGEVEALLQALLPRAMRAALARAIRGVRGLSPDQLLFLNIEPDSIYDPVLRSEAIVDLLCEADLRPTQVVLEITEHAAVHDHEAFRQMLDYFRFNGFRLAVDDVGSGYSGLKSIAELRPDYIKIDMALIRDIQKRTGAEAFNAVLSFGGMPYDLAESSLRLFATEVMPELKRCIPIQDQLIARAGVGQSADASAFRLPI